MLNVIRRAAIECTQYGLTPKRIAFRLFGGSAPRVLANSIPKSGTNLLLRTLYLMHPLHRKLMRTLVASDPCDMDRVEERLRGLRDGEVAAGHLKYHRHLDVTLSEGRIKHVLMVRDPRDIAVSNFVYLTRIDRKHRLHDYFSRVLKTDDERLMASIQGVPGNLLPDGVDSLSLAEHMRGYMEWKENSDCLVVRFEDLVGAAGGGSEEKQLSSVSAIARHIGLDLDDDELRSIAGRLFNPGSRTFFRGQIGTWREHFKDMHMEAVRASLGNAIVQLGYE